MSDYVFKPGEYRTRGGYRARLYATDGGGEFPLHGAIDYFGGGFEVARWKTSGHFHLSADTHGNDLLPPEPEKVTRWVNVYLDGRCYAYRTREAADKSALHCRIACIRITYHEGQYDE